MLYRPTVPLRLVFSDNFPPKIATQTSVINATLYKTVELNITAVDNDTITFRVINKPAGAIENQSGHELYFTWNVTSKQKVGYLDERAFSQPRSQEYQNERPWEPVWHAVKLRRLRRISQNCSQLL